MSGLDSALVCAGCGARLAPEALLPFRCPRAGAGGDVDHVLARELDLSETRWPAGDEAQPFVRFRSLLHAWRYARRAGLSDEAYVARVHDLDARLAGVAASGLHETPLLPCPELAAELGVAELRVKDETGQPGGSHKVRHLFGLALWLALVDARHDAGPLAIASCGNAALAAALLAKAVGRPLEVFVPDQAEPAVVARLAALGAQVVVCERGSDVGDPCVARMRERVARGALPFGCQGSENGLTIEGGTTLGLELVAQASGALDRVVIQAGGGALASATFEAFGLARRLGALDRLPRVDCVQSEAVSPLVCAWERYAAAPHADAAKARSTYMRPSEGRGQSVASGILDDECYDWLACCRGMAESGGRALTVSEAQLSRARSRARTATGIAVSATGAAGLAGLYALVEARDLGKDERVAVLFTGGEA